MSGRECCVTNCYSSSHDHQGRMLLNGLSFHCFPAWRKKEGALISELTRRRRAAWVAAVRSRDITFDRIPSSMRICSKHFVSGKPAYEMLDSDPDWVPSLHLGHNVDNDEGKGNSRNKRRRLSSEEKPAEGADGAAEVKKPPQPPWKDVKTALQSLLESRTTVTQQPRDDAQNRAAGKRTVASFREFFRNALESSLEASIQARARSKSRSSSTEYEVNLNFELPSPGGEPATCKDSPSCVNCSRMLRRIQELEQKLVELDSKQEQADSEEAPVAGTQPGQDQHGSEEEEEDMDESTDHVETAEVLDFSSEGKPDFEASPLSSDPSDLSSSSSVSSMSSTSSVPPTSRPSPAVFGPQHRLRFRKEWLKDFPFLRYSPTLNVMWCHVCRVHSEPFCRNHRLIKGSFHFTKNNIMKHSNSFYHQHNMQRFLWSSQRLSVEPQP